MRDKSNISMSDKAFIAPHDFIEKIKARFNLNRDQAEHLAFSSWRKFKLILAKNPHLSKSTFISVIVFLHYSFKNKFMLARYSPVNI